MGFQCSECDAIRREISDLPDASHRGKPGSRATPEQLAAWFDELDEDQEGKMRRTVALAFPPQGGWLTNPN